ncbi:TIGR04255 family protein [Usitatibacter palustris]|uniref:TIGR04255 family protein n=1 Tax=Usitatibacter palustris TaxID=2732487 RepID=A0A6M4H3V7_9PROT|nr:TIGR04255 family protein [Usitatibacter palustris]QJR14206.1 hypothetical protein DSM104440_00999 [Usitatibacter palustris]
MVIAVRRASLGQLPNAPLALVLAQVVFSRHLSMRDRIPAIQDAVRREYPTFAETKIHALEIGAAGIKTKQVDRWQFGDATNQAGFLILEDGLVFNATAYRDYPAFAERLSTILGMFEALVPDLHVERLGLRYVDIIVPAGDEEPEEFIVSGLRATELSNIGRHANSMHFSQIFLDEGYLNFRYKRGGLNEHYMPDDLQPFILAPAAVTSRAKHAQSQGRSIAFLDFDRIVPNLSLRFDSAEVRSRFDRMHKDLSDAFKKVQTPHARKVWSTPP